MKTEQQIRRTLANLKTIIHACKIPPVASAMIAEALLWVLEEKNEIDVVIPDLQRKAARIISDRN